MSDPHHRTLRSVQLEIERVYGLERTADVVDFVRMGAESSRETLVLRQRDDELEIALVLPPVSDPLELTAPHYGPSDAWLQLVEGVSHFVYVAERARTELPATMLELELQAEVDKYAAHLLAGNGVGAIRERSRILRERLFEGARFLDAPESVEGERYRTAHRLAARYAAALERRYVDRGRLAELAVELRRFYRMGAREKLEWIRQ